MFNGIKNFAINRILRHVADNPKLNTATNILALIPVVILVAVNNNADWSLMMQCCTAKGSLAEVVRVAALLVGAILLWFTGKMPVLKSWLPVAVSIIEEVEKEVIQKDAAAGKQ